MPGPLPFVNGVAKIVVHGSFNLRPVVNVLHYFGGAGVLWDTTSFPALVTGIRNSWKSRFLPRLSNGFVLGNVDGQDLTGPTGLFVSVAGSDGGGNISGTNLPINVAMCVSWHIPRHYRGGHPRMYLGGLKTSDTADPGHWDETVRTGMQTAAQGFVADLAALTPPSTGLCTVHYRMHNVALAVPLVDLVTTATIDARIDTQRRRLGKV